MIDFTRGRTGQLKRKDSAKMLEKIEIIKKMLEKIFCEEMTEEDVQHYLECGYLTETCDSEGNTYYWYLDSDGCEIVADKEGNFVNLYDFYKIIGEEPSYKIVSEESNLSIRQQAKLFNVSEGTIESYIKGDYQYGELSEEINKLCEIVETERENIKKLKSYADISIKEAREKAGLTQSEMSERLNIPKRTIEAWEMGTRKPADYVKALIIEKLLNM